MVDYEVFDLGDGRLQMGATLRDAKLAYKPYGELNQDRSNGDIGKTPGFDGDVERALGAITARAIVMPAVGMTSTRPTPSSSTTRSRGSSPKRRDVPLL